MFHPMMEPEGSKRRKLYVDWLMKREKRRAVEKESQEEAAGVSTQEELWRALSAMTEEEQGEGGQEEDAAGLEKEPRS